MCRDYALRLSEIKPELDAEGVELVAIGHEMLGLGEFYMEGFWKGQLFVDTSKDIFRELNTVQGNLLGLMAKETLEAGKLATERGTEGNLEGDGFQLGGVWVFAADGCTVFEYISRSFGDHPTPQEVLEAARSAKAQ